MEPNAPRTVLENTFLTSLSGVGVGTIFGIWKTRRGGSWSTTVLTSGATGFNMGVHGLAFFAIREYVTTPILLKTLPWSLYVRRREWLEQNPPSTNGRWPPELLESYPQAITFSELRMDKLADSTITGSALGGLINTFRKGRFGIFSGIITGGLLCSSLQFLWNELNVLRIKFVSEKRGIQQPFGENAPNITEKRTLSESILDSLAIVLPLKKMSHEDYIERLIRQRENVEARMEEIRKELEELEKIQSTNEKENNEK